MNIYKSIMDEIPIIFEEKEKQNTRRVNGNPFESDKMPLIKQ